MRNIGENHSYIFSATRHVYILTLFLCPGGDNGLAVVLSIYNPHVQCRGRLNDASACKVILADMPASRDILLFGPEGTADIQEDLPQIVASCESMFWGNDVYEIKPETC